jgi:hypothetical protein
MRANSRRGASALSRRLTPEGDAQAIADIVFATLDIVRAAHPPSHAPARAPRLDDHQASPKSIALLPMCFPDSCLGSSHLIRVDLRS